MSDATTYRLSDFDFELPAELVAQVPAPERSDSRLLHVAGSGFEDRGFRDLPDLLEPGDVLVFNDTRVMRSRLFGNKATGGKIEILLERIVAPREGWAQIRASHAPKVGSAIRLAGGARATVIAREERLFLLRFALDRSLEAYLEAHGEVPLPPYITRAADARDADRYQTVYAKHSGAVAAPTAGLHFDATLLARLRARGVDIAYVTLHVGAGTFLPVETEDLARHRMHSERYTIRQETVDCIERARAAGRSIVAVGTTTLRALESAAADGALRAGDAETSLFITPGYRFRVVDRLLTNFHLPRSTLLILVSAFAGHDIIRAAYSHAMLERYRFFSYGDAMLLHAASDY
jgi:S-adenosylmethionine:tRNA ribosyltransferase-isomerase